MAIVNLSLADVDNASAKGTVMPALRGRAQHFQRTVTASATFQIDGSDWVAQVRGFARFTVDADVFVRFAPVDDDTAAGPGAGWRVLPGLDCTLSFEPGDRIVWAAA